MTAITPDSGNNNGTAHISDLAGTWFSDVGGAPEVRLKRSGQVDIVVTGVSVVSESRIACDFDLYGAQPGAWDVVVRNADGQEGELAGAFTVNPAIWYLAEGSAAGDMETWVLVQNPNPDPVAVSLTLMTDTDLQRPEPLQNQAIGGNSRVSFPLHNYVPTFNVSTKVEASGEVICERAM